MISNTMSDAAILREIGIRLERVRLTQNMTQAALSNLSGVSLRTIQKVEDGKSSTLKTLVAMLRGLDSLAELDNFIPEPPISPVQLSRLKGKQRRRATGTRKKAKDSCTPDTVREEPLGWTWDE